jgi:hypothetical protein
MRRCIAAKCIGFRRTPKGSRHGYVLLMTLALLVIAALAEAGLARRSLQSALEANLAQAGLQRRWAAASCRDTILAHADELFVLLEDAKDRRPRWPAPGEIQAQFSLAGQSVELALGDEDAKTNLNTLYARKPADVRLVITDAAHGAFTPELRPDLTSEAKIRRRYFDSWGQVFPIASVLSEADGWKQLAQAARQITCWGSGKPNIRRASDSVLEKAATAAVGSETARKLLQARRTCQEDLLLDSVLEGLPIKRLDQVKLRSALGDRSSCYSLWLALGDDRRHWYHLWVQGDRGSAVPGGVQSFHW